MTNTVNMRLVRIPAGTFMMGTSDKARARGADEYAHTVQITADFWIGDREVTRGQFRQIMSFVPETDTGIDPSLPVTGVTWHEANEFCRLLSKAEGRIYHLPSEAQWEYACRAGTSAAFAGSGRIEDMGWYQGSPGPGGLRRPGAKTANHWGLFDFHGNAAEWCDDRYLPTYPLNPNDLNAPVQDPLIGGTPEQIRVIRGGSFNSIADDCRSAARDKLHPYKSKPDLGFRVIMEERAPLGHP
jgi:formylglycine-generating enzyme required for sulfatase activity